MAPPPLPDVTGVLVAGGRGLRMGGVPKGTLRLDGASIAGRSLDLFRALFGRTLIVADDPGPYAGLGSPVIPDAIAGKGAPGGLHAALAAAGTGWIFAAACDMPFLAEGPIRFLWERRGESPAVMARRAGQLEPLHAFWSKACLQEIERQLRGGSPGLQRLAAAVGARVVEEEEWRLADPGGRALENANTPEDAARLGLTGFGT